MAIAAVVAGNRIITTDVNQFYNILKGVTGSGETVTLIYNAAGSLVFQPSSDPAADTQAVQIKNNAGTVQSYLTYDGNLGLKTYIAVGTTPATAGPYRIPNAQYLTARNAANGANINLIGLDAGNVIEMYGGVFNIDASGNLSIPVAGTNITVGGTTGGKVIVAGTVTAGGLLGTGLQVGTSGPLVYSGSGAPTISAAVKGSLYLRTDGSGTTDRIYVAKDTAGAWASLTAAS